MQGMDQTLQEKIKSQGMPIDAVMQQLEQFKTGFPFLKIIAPATANQGVQVWNEQETNRYQNYFSSLAPKKKIVKFVPASGAASRMFKDLFTFLEGYTSFENSPFVKKFIQEIHKFAFYEDLDRVMTAQGMKLPQALAAKDYTSIVSSLVSNEGLGYGNLPKGLLKFHAYSKERRTPAHEHLIEGLRYGIGKNNEVQIHFTVSPEHESGFRSEISSLLPTLQQETGIQFHVNYSHQKKTTDTLAVDLKNQPFFEEDGSLLFRPAGHGALLENLNEIHADLIFIKNIDNVVPDRLKEITTKYKLALGGYLLEIQEKVFAALAGLDDAVTESSLKAAIRVYTEELGGILPESVTSADLTTQATFIRKKLHRPIRVCGMVKNTGEPGGGPFWIQEEDGSRSLQILETAQINLEDPVAKQHLSFSTHFNPVDLVCGIKDYKGNSFDLLQFRDMSTGFITEKSKNGKVVKALELPGLWNGAMAYWNTLFVEVPLLTFNPVKTINDLLREEHQA
jgi:Domain of unknown function (DUF4301)